jgi:hypothetical protein
VRSRFFIPAAIVVAAAYLKGRQDAQLFAPATAPAPAPERVERAEAEAADAWEMGLEEPDEAVVAAAEAAAALAVAPPPPPAPSPEPVWIPDFDDVLVPESAPSVCSPSRDAVWEPDPVALSEWVAQPAGAAARVEASGRFAIGGWAAQAGHMAFCGVTFPSRVVEDVEAGRVRIVPDVLQNVTADGLVVPAEAGFAPDAEGFTLLVAAAGPGPFAASGRYELIAGSAG